MTYKIINSFFALICLLAMTGACNYHGLRHTEACSLRCPRSFPLVCGSDGRTYYDKCHLKIVNGVNVMCQVENGVYVVYEGPCDQDKGLFYFNPFYVALIFSSPSSFHALECFDRCAIEVTETTRLHPKESCFPRCITSHGA